MPVFVYKAANPDQSIARGTIAGNSPLEARELLRDRGMQVLELDQKTTGKQVNKGVSSLVSRTRFNKEVASSASELGTLLSVGVPLLEAIDTLTQQYEGKFRGVLIHLRDEVASGVSLADAMRNQPQVFDILSISMVEVGENTGNLDSVLTQLSEFKSRSLEFKDKVLSSMMYPLIVLSVAVMVMLFLMVFVVPMLLNNLLDAGRALPWPTRVLKFASDTLVAHWWWVAILTFLAITALALYRRTEHGCRLWFRLLLKIPILGDLSRKQEISRVAMVVATLTSSGVDFIKSLDIASRTTKNILLQDALNQCRDRIQSGGDIGQVMGNQQYLPPMVAQIFTVGQKSGRLEEMLFRLASDYDRQVQTAANRLQSVLEPILIVALSVFVGFILFATLLPILEAGNVLSQ